MFIRQMAQSKLTSFLTEEFLSCSLCYENFQDPRALNCLHTFCNECLKKYVKAKETQPGQDLECPFCRRAMTLPKDGVDGLHKNHWIKNLADAVKDTRTSEQDVCMMCTDKAPSVVRCLECSSGLCQKCKESHQRMLVFQSHSLVSYDDIKEGKFLEKWKSTPALCQEHRMPRELFCNRDSCNHSICVKCKAHDHDGHYTIKMEEKATEEQENLKELKTSLEKAENILKSEMEKGTSASSQIKSRAKSLSTEVHKRGEAMKKCIQLEVDATISLIKEFCNADQKELKAILDSVEGNLKNHQSAHQIVKNILDQSCIEDMVTVAPDLIREMSELSSRDHEDIAWDQWRPLVFKEGKQSSEMFKEIIGSIHRKSDNFSVGDYVKVKESVTSPNRGWGEVTHKSVGIVTEIIGDAVMVDFPEQKRWKGDCSEMEPANRR